VRDGKAAGLVLDTGEEIVATHVLSSAGSLETAALIGEKPPKVRSLGYVETISVLNRSPADLGWGDDTIVFFNDSARLAWACPEGQVDVRSGVVCIPNNFDHGEGQRLPDGIVRATCLANYDRWATLPEETYRADKARWYDAIQASFRRFLPAVGDAALASATVATDMFTPRTVEKFTGRRNGAIYGAAVKQLDGRTALANLHLCGTDQGLIGIVGAMLSGITMANERILRKPA
jgi:phytoene dehydrogenase-like protein